MGSGKTMKPHEPAGSDEQATRFRFVIIGMLFLMAVINYVDRGALSYTSEQLIKEYSFSKSEWGSVLGYFGYGYMFGAVLGGTLSDRWGPRQSMDLRRRNLVSLSRSPAHMLVRSA